MSEKKPFPLQIDVTFYTMYNYKRVTFVVLCPGNNQVISVTEKEKIESHPLGKAWLCKGNKKLVIFLETLIDRSTRFIIARCTLFKFPATLLNRELIVGGKFKKCTQRNDDLCDKSTFR